MRSKCWRLALFLFLAAAEASGSAAGGDAQPRFFLAGNGWLRMRDAHTGEELHVRYRRPDGSYDPRARAEIDRFFRSRVDAQQSPIALRLIELLGYIQARYRPREMVLISGYRSPGFNAALRSRGVRAALASLHTQALAADVALAGVDARHLWEDLRRLGAGGAGYYGQEKFLHVDVGPPRFWEAATSRVEENLSAGNARMFARTEFDRYLQLQGALASLHSVTAFPVRVASQGELVLRGARFPVAVAPFGFSARREGDCFLIEEARPGYPFQVLAAVVEEARASRPLRGRAHLVFHTCEPRIEKTPRDLESNPIEIGAGR